MSRIALIAKTIASVQLLAEQDFLTIAKTLERAFGITTDTKEIGEAFDTGITEAPDAKKLSSYLAPQFPVNYSPYPVCR